MTGNARAPESRKFPVSASESPKLKIELYLKGLLVAYETVQKKQKTRGKLTVLMVTTEVGD